MDSFGWKRLGLVAILLTSLALLVEHVLPHGRDLNPVDHWLSEYVLSSSASAPLIMRFGFVGLALSALSVGQIHRDRVTGNLMRVAAIALAAMVALDTNSNDGRAPWMSWPPSAANLHQVALYVTLGACVLAIARDARLTRARLVRFCSAFAFVAVGLQLALVTFYGSRSEMTRFGGLTERAIVVVLAVWALDNLLRRPVRSVTSPHAVHDCHPGQNGEHALSR